MSTALPRAWARLDYVDAGTLAFSFPYRAEMVVALKQALRQSARWDGAGKRWLVDPAYAQMCADLARDWLGVQVALPTLPATLISTGVGGVVLLEYLGRTKVDLSGDAWATGFAEGNWSLRFPESVLREWFEVMPEDAAPGQSTTLYGALGLKPAATPDEIKAAYRRLARANHPDVCHDPDAHEVFIALGNAYRTLSDPIQRRRYDAGLALEAQTRADQFLAQRTRQNDLRYRSQSADYHGKATGRGYRAPLTCGYLAVEGTPKLGQLHVSRIVAWEDVTNDQGQVMTSFWNRHEKKHEIAWVDY